MKISISSYHRTFDAPGAPVVFGVEITDCGKIGNRNIPPFILQVAESDAELIAMAQGQGKETWDEETLIECAKVALELDESQVVTVKKPPVVS